MKLGKWGLFISSMLIVFSTLIYIFLWALGKVKLSEETAGEIMYIFIFGTILSVVILAWLFTRREKGQDIESR